MESLKEFLNDHLQISSIDWALISAHLKSKSIEKNEALTKYGDVEDKIYFLQEGVLRLYYEMEHRDITLSIAFPKSFISSYSSFLTRTKSDFILEAVTKCELAYMTYDSLEQIYATTNCGHQLGRIFTERMFLYLSKRENSFLFKSPTQRYLDMFEEQPRLILEIPQKYLASYIGITPQALSRIRARLS